jgi:transaldolase
MVAPTIKIFADCADSGRMVELARNPLISGFTTNPTLMRKAGVAYYKAFARLLIELMPNHPISFEVLADDFPTMIAQARAISSWGPNVYVKIPVTNTNGEFSGEVIETLSGEGIKLNITAVMTNDQAYEISHSIRSLTPMIVSVFAGRIADTGKDPTSVLRACKEASLRRPTVELLWASSRKLLNVFQAQEAGCDIITLPPDLIEKFPLIGKDLTEYSRETVQQFHQDAITAGFTIKSSQPVE